MKCRYVFLKNGWCLVMFCFVFMHVAVNGLHTVRGYPQRANFTNFTSQEKIVLRDIKIANGENVVDGEFPYIVAVFRAFPGKPIKHHASGAIITKSHVLTACHVLVVDSKDGAEIDVNNLALPLEIAIMAGTVDLNDTDGKGVVRYGKQLKVHPLCKRTEVSMDYDVGIILMLTPLELVPGRIEILEIPHYKCTALVNELVAKSETCVTMGWGIIEDLLEWDILQKITVGLKPFDWCEKTIRALTDRNPHGPDQFNDLNQVCAVGVENKTTICAGDSGSPLMCQDAKVLVGIVSYGPGEISCGKDKWPGGFARIDVVQDFISEFIESTSLDYKVFTYHRCQSPVNVGFIAMFHTSSIIMTAFVVIGQTVCLSI